MDRLHYSIVMIKQMNSPLISQRWHGYDILFPLNTENTTIFKDLALLQCSIFPIYKTKNSVSTKKNAPPTTLNYGRNISWQGEIDARQKKKNMDHSLSQTLTQPHAQMATIFKTNVLSPMRMPKCKGHLQEILKINVFRFYTKINLISKSILLYRK